MTIPRLRDITAYQADNPPLHELVARYMGVGKTSSKARELDGEGKSLFDVAPQSVK
jgi:hypothetical protein